MNSECNSGWHKESHSLHSTCPSCGKKWTSMSMLKQRIFVKDHCPDCGEHLCYDEVDIGVGVIRSPVWCLCGWSEDYGTNELDLIDHVDAELADALEVPR